MSEPKWTALCAWAAGLFEGEGCVYLKHSEPDATHKTARLEAVVTMTNTERVLLERLRDTWGGNIRACAMTPKSRRPLFKWDLYSTRMERFLRDILPFVIAGKRPKIEKVLELRERQRLDGRTRDNFGRIARLAPSEASWRQNLSL
jgi:hypothetical protein